MKKVISISLVLLVIASVMHISVAAHFCGGELASSNLSLTAKLAECGMESNKTTPSSETSYNQHCCDNTLTFYAINNNYLPTSQILTAGAQQSNIQLFSIFPQYALPSEIIPRSLNSNISPPGVLLSTHVDLPDICVFRI